METIDIVVKNPPTLPKFKHGGSKAIVFCPVCGFRFVTPTNVIEMRNFNHCQWSSWKFKCSLCKVVFLALVRENFDPYFVKGCDDFPINKAAINALFSKDWFE